jgi:hypothetical protein
LLLLPLLLALLTSTTDSSKSEAAEATEATKDARVPSEMPGERRRGAAAKKPALLELAETGRGERLLWSRRRAVVGGV